jgi:adenosylcobinamide kinase/adenosylcobinamide-phosphate guanylyltransferase
MRPGKELILILGGVRAGKSSFAHRLACELGGPVTFVATAEAGDEEMRRRIEEHKRGRPSSWRTLEASLQPSAALQQSALAGVVVLDCLTLLVSNLLLQDGDPSAAQQRVEQEVTRLLSVFAAGEASFIIVSNEVGMGVVPPYELGRVYRDLLGEANRRLAQAADRVYWMVAGLPVEIKASGLAGRGEGIGVED